MIGLGRLLTFALVAAIAQPPHVARADSAQTAVTGDVRDRRDGAAVAGANVLLEDLRHAHVASTTTDERGAFAVFVPAPGRYEIDVTARGFRPLAMTIVAGPDAPRADFRLTLDDRPKVIGDVVSHAAVRSDGSSTDDVSPSTLANDGALRATDALARLGGVTVTGDAAAPGGDAYVSLRGLRPSESVTLLDGHPVGPIGVAGAPPDADGTIAGFNFQDAPYFALRDVVVNFGAAGSDAVAGDAIGGTVDLRTIDPTQSLALGAEQGLGTQGRAYSALHATGTQDKFAFALAYGVDGTYGNFPGSTIAQTGLRGTDFTSATLAALTYHVSGDYDVRNLLAKIAYGPNAATKVTLTAYGATSWADKTGEGDNDDNPYAYTLANAPVGASASCPRGVLVTGDGGTSCLSATAYASAASGPAGGGPDAWQALRNQDYDLRATSSSSASTLAVDAFTDAYAEVYHRGASAVNGPLDTFLDRWSTQGVRASDQFTWRTNGVGFGVSWLRQVLGGDASAPDGSALVTPVPASRFERSVFASDAFSPNPQWTLRFFFDAKRSSNDAATRLDPQVALSYRPTTRDTLRLGAGRATEEPSLQTNRVNLEPVGALNPDCGAIASSSASAPATVGVGSGPAPGLAPETGTDLEAGFEHRFGSAATLGLTAYDTNVTDRIVTGTFDASSALSPAQLANYVGRIASFCGTAPAPGAVVFGLDRAFNAANARLRGFEFSGRARIAPRVTLDFAYDVQSSVLGGVPASVLGSDPTIVNGRQVFGVPLDQATLGVELTAPSGLTLRLDGHAVGQNNPQQLPGYAYADASLARDVSKRVRLRIAIANVFDSHAQIYGFEGLGVPYATNAYNAAIGTPFLQPYNERYGLQPTALTVSATVHL